MATEDKFPTIRDLRDALTLLCNLGLGELATQVTVVPASTIVAVARIIGPKQMAAHGDKPPLMIELDQVNGRMAPVIVSADFLDTSKYPLPPLGRQ